jgi:hypothetical protein
MWEYILSQIGNSGSGKLKLLINRQQINARQNVYNRIAKAKQQDQHNHRRSAPYAELWAAEAFTRGASQQRRYNRRPDRRRQAGIADGVEETIGFTSPPIIGGIKVSSAVLKRPSALSSKPNRSAR